MLILIVTVAMVGWTVVCAKAIDSIISKWPKWSTLIAGILAAVGITLWIKEERDNTKLVQDMHKKAYEYANEIMGKKRSKR